MARQVAPGTPTEIKAKQYNVDMPDWSFLEKMGDKKIKAANANFKLYAEALVTTESQKLYEQYKDDPINLSNALGKLPDMLKDLPEEIQSEMTKKLYLNGVSLVSKAQTNRDAKDAREAKMNAMKVAENTGNTISTDYFNLLTYLTAPDDQKREVDVEIYATNRVNLSDMAELKDAKGEYVFSEKQRGMMKMPSDAMLDGFKQFIYRPDLKQLQKWDEEVFQNRDKFIKDTAIDSKTYESMEKVLKERLKQLKDDDVRKVKSQAMFETADLIKNGNDKARVAELRKNSNAPKGLIDKAVKLNEQIVKSEWYNPERSSDPTSALQVMQVVGEIANDTDTSPDGLERKVEKAMDALDLTIKSAPKANYSDSDLRQMRDWLSDAITNDGLAKNIQMLDITPWVESVVEAKKADMEKNFAMYEPKALEKLEAELEAYHSKGKLTPLEKKAEESVLETTKHGWIQRERSHRLAYNNAKMGLYQVMDYLRATGDVDGAKNMLSQVKYNYIKTYNSDWIAGSEFDRLQKEFDEGKKAVYLHNGILWEYNGYQNDGAIFTIKL